MRFHIYPAVLAAAASCLLLSACEDEVSQIGNSLIQNEVDIMVEEMTLQVAAETLEESAIDARGTLNQLGHISVPEYGELDASFAARMLSASSLILPEYFDIEKVDSMKMYLEAPRNTAIGDTVAPQQLRVYALTKALPDNMTSAFDPAGYYNAGAPAGKVNYTMSALALTDSAFKKGKFINIGVRLPKEWAVSSIKAYREHPGTFEWPKNLQQYFPGIYLKPSFGRGCIANISAVKMFAYYHHFVKRTVMENDVPVEKEVRMKDSVCLYTSAPEVLSGTLYKYTPAQTLRDYVAQGKHIITTPLGFSVRLQFPAKQLLESYWATEKNLSVINNLTFAIPATPVGNSYGIGVVPDLLMIRTSEIEDFFANGKVPDNKTSFRGKYNSDSGRYEFSSMRQYIVDLKNSGKTPTEEECSFTLIPVKITQEVQPTNGEPIIYVTGCTPYLQTPTMTLLDMEKALVVFTHTSQIAK